MKYVLIALIVMSLLVSPLYADSTTKTSILQATGVILMLSGAVCMAYGFSQTSTTEAYIDKLLLTDIYVNNTGRIIPESYVYVERHRTVSGDKNKALGWAGAGLLASGIVVHHISKDLSVEINNERVNLKYNIDF